MYDLIKTRQTPHTEPFVGQYLRSSGSGDRIIKVHTYDPSTRSGTVISWGRLTYGHVDFAKQAYVRPFTASVSATGNWWSVDVPNKGWHGGWTYSPIDIYSVFHDVGTAYDMGGRSAKSAMRGQYSFHNYTDKQIWEHCARKKQWACPFKKDRELELAWLDGFDNQTAKGLPERKLKLRGGINWEARQ